MKSAVKTLSMALCAAFVLTALAAASAEAFDVQSQVGPNPVLPDIQQYLFPQMHLSSVAGWKNGETPTVAAGLKIEALATGLQHPRSLYVLPNGDVLVVESKAPRRSRSPGQKTSSCAPAALRAFRGSFSSILGMRGSKSFPIVAAFLENLL
jgi:glucose/arabinose dehydrogenase